MPGPVKRWRKIRDAVHAEVLDRGWNPEVGAFTQYYGGNTLDAATLLMPAVGFLPGEDERVCSTIAAVQQQLQHGVLVSRYTTRENEHEIDGLRGREGFFLACSFWMVDALAMCGRRKEAEEMFEALLRLANDVGLYAEEFDVHNERFTGNFPLAFSHLALVNSAAVLFGGHTREEASRRNGPARD